MPINPDYIGTVQNIEIFEVNGLIAELEERATDTQLQSETSQRISADDAIYVALDLKAPINNPGFTGTVSGITKAMVGLDSVDNTSDADKIISNNTLTALNFKAPINNPEFTGTVSGITKAMVGLDSVDNTSDADKPVSTAQQTAIALKSNIASPSFTGTGTFTKADNYGQLELTDTNPVGAGVGGGITLNGVYGGSGQITSLAHIKAKKSNATIGNYSGDLSLSVRENGGGGYTEVIKLKGEDLKTILNGGLNVAGSVDLEALPTSAQTGTKLWNNNGAINIGAGASGGSGACLESIQEVLRGQNITTVNGDTITLPNITAVVQPNQTGSHSILATITNYIPPSGTKSVMLTLKFFIGWNGVGGSCDALFDCRVNSELYTAGVITSQSYIKSNTGMGEIGEYEINCLINIDSSIEADDLPNGKIKTWTSGYTFNFASSRILDTAQVFIFSNNPHPYNTATLKFIAPILMIKAYS